MAASCGAENLISNCLSKYQEGSSSPFPSPHPSTWTLL